MNFISSHAAFSPVNQLRNKYDIVDSVHYLRNSWRQQVSIKIYYVFMLYIFVKATVLKLT